MLNEISVFDLTNYIARRIMRVLCVSVLTGLLLGMVKFMLVYRGKAGLNYQIGQMYEEMQENQHVYEQYCEYVENSPVNLIHSVETYSSTVTYSVSSSDKGEGIREETAAFIDSVISAWNSRDISEVTKGRYPESVDDAALRDVVKVSADAETILRLIAKSHDESDSISLLGLFDEFLSDLITAEAENSAYKFSFEKSETATKCAYDKEVYWAQSELRSNLKDLKKEYQKSVDDYEVLLIRNDPVRQAIKWGVLGLVVSLLMYVCVLVAQACVWEPALSAEHVTRRTGLSCNGVLQLPDRIRSMKEIVKAGTHPLIKENDPMQFSDLIRGNMATDDKLSLVCFSDEALDQVTRVTGQNDSALGKDDLSIYGFSDYVKTADLITNILYIVVLDKTRIDEIKKAQEVAENSNSTIKGFVLI